MGREATCQGGRGPNQAGGRRGKSPRGTGKRGARKGGGEKGGGDRKVSGGEKKARVGRVMGEIGGRRKIYLVVRGRQVTLERLR
jgi:hypothetical protein